MGGDCTQVDYFSLAQQYWPILELVEAMPLGHEFATSDFADTTHDRMVLGTVWTLNPRFTALLWGPLAKRKNCRVVRVWTRGPAPMPDDPMALVGAWWAAHPERNSLSVADLDLPPQYRCGVERWLAETFEATQQDGRHAPGYTRNPRRWMVR